MEKAIIAPQIPVRRRNREHPFLRAALALGLLVACGYAGIFTIFQPNKNTLVKVPVNAQHILHKCASLNVVPGPPSNFHSREESDRYVAGTKATLIKNATIWTGNVDGLEVVLGDLLLDKGIIKAVGRVSTEELSAYQELTIILAHGAWVSPGIVDLHSHLGDSASPFLQGASDTNSVKGLVQPWLRSLDALNTHDDAYRLSISGGVTTSVVLPGSANAIGGQAFVIKLRPTEERTPSSMLLEPPFTFNGSGIIEVQPPRWRLLKRVVRLYDELQTLRSNFITPLRVIGENPSRVYSGTRMDTIWAYRQGYEEARKLKVKQDDYCAKAVAGKWNEVDEKFPDDLKWEALVDVLRGKVKIQNHCYEAVDLDGIVRLTNEFKFSSVSFSLSPFYWTADFARIVSKVAAFHHAHETFLVPDLLKKAYGHTPAVALFATNARYKREAYRGSEFAPRILADQGIQVVMKSDHPVLNSRYLLHEAQQAHYYGLDSNLALASVTSTPAKIMGQDHRIGFIRKGYDADVVIWDSHPLALGATPKQVFIDGVAQLEHPYTIAKPSAFQHVPKTPGFKEEREAALEYDGLPPLGPKKSFPGIVMFKNIGSLFLDKGHGIEQIFSPWTENNDSSDAIAPQIAVVENGKIVCIGSTSEECSSSAYLKAHIVDLDGGSLAPGLLSYGSSLGLVHISGERSTQDGTVPDGLTGKVPAILGGDLEAVIRASDGLLFSSRDALLAYRSGVTTGVTAPDSRGLLAGIGTAFSTGAAHKLVQGAVVQNEAALHVALSLSSSVSVSTQMAALRNLLLGGAKGDLGAQVTKVVEGKIPLVISVHNADIMASLVRLKEEVESVYKSKIQVTFAGATEAHLLAKEIGDSGIGVIVSPARPFPDDWERKRILPGPPLTQDSAITTLLAHNVTVGVGIVEAWAARNTRLDIGWAALESDGKISKAEAIALASSNLAKLLGLPSDTTSTLVATTGGTILDFESKVVGIVSAQRGVVDLF
ncbi:hypothetical protein D9757_001113 [Collybiopsis confluens]|uniref:Amidohydrolase-related domain-containing protein n=1 Tax=Collybiopsis confluens TaxID=2823264 RepID=A0A8H5I111_9AGAR|nr:hypothetical protein D9757_001113 [Collybiopsis confluens]